MTRLFYSHMCELSKIIIIYCYMFLEAAECECVEWECEEKLDNILLKERN